MKIEKICKVCDKVFYVRPYKKDTAKYCSYKCYWKDQTGKHLSIEHKRKIGEAQKGEKHHFYGKKHSQKTKDKISQSRKGKCSGSENPAWIGGQAMTKEGYIFIYKPDHPFCTTSKYVLEHRLIMESHLGRYLDPKEVVHHINDINNDNRLENLKLFKNHSEHMKFHHPKGVRFHKKISPFPLDY